MGKRKHSGTPNQTSPEPVGAPAARGVRGGGGTELWVVGGPNLQRIQMEKPRTREQGIHNDLPQCPSSPRREGVQRKEVSVPFNQKHILSTH